MLYVKGSLKLRPAGTSISKNTAVRLAALFVHHDVYQPVRENHFREHVSHYNFPLFQ